ncbi:hypothetical protein LCGC14_2787350, partial [marine sediment metagenome]
MANYNRKPRPVEGKKREVIIEEKGFQDDVQKIWGVNPSYKHVNNNITIARIVALGALIIFIISSLNILTSQLMISLLSGAIILALFLFVFYDNLFVLRNLGFFSFKRMSVVDPFKNILFLMRKESLSTIIISNKKDLVHTALKLFKIEVIPENVHASVNLFLKGLSAFKNMIKFTYQIIQTPVYSRISNGESFETSIYFCIFYTINGSLTRGKLDSIYNQLDFLGNTLKSNFIANFHHFKIVLLKGIGLVNGLRSYFFKTDTPTQELRSSIKIISPNFLM